MMIAILLGVALQAPPGGAKPQAAPAGGQPAQDQQLRYRVDGAGQLTAKLDTPKVEPMPTTLDGQIGRALENHPDLRVAQLQVELAQAKLAQEQQRVTQRISTARASYDALKVVADNEAEVSKRVLNSGASPSEISQAEGKLAQAKYNLAVAEVELQAAVGPAPVVSPWATIYGTGNIQILPAMVELRRGAVVSDHKRAPSTAKPTGAGGSIYLDWSVEAATPEGFLANFPDMLDRRITPRKKGGTLREIVTELLTLAAGDKPVPVVRYADNVEHNFTSSNVMFAPDGRTDSLGAWLEYMSDAIGPIHVREYGLIFTGDSAPPAGAMTVSEFWKRSRAAKAARAKAEAGPVAHKPATPKAKD